MNVDITNCGHRAMQDRQKFFVGPRDVGIADAHGDAAALEYPINKLAHLFVGLVGEESWLAVIVVAFERA